IGHQLRPQRFLSGLPDRDALLSYAAIRRRLAGQHQCAASDRQAAAANGRLYVAAHAQLRRRCIHRRSQLCERAPKDLLQNTDKNTPRGAMLNRCLILLAIGWFGLTAPRRVPVTAQDNAPDPIQKTSPKETDK